MIIEKSSLILALELIIIISLIPTIISISVVEAGKDKDYNNNNNNNKQVTERDIAVLCGASEDYEKNKEQCNKLYEMLEEGVIEDDPDFEYD